jgi:hypothetical protein
MNGCSASVNDRLVSDAEGRCRIEISTDDVVRRALPLDTRPAARVRDSIRNIAKEAATTAFEVDAWMWWLATPPLASDVLKDHGLARREAILIRDITVVESVCHRPRKYLRRVTERSLLGRARRLASGADQFLAAHPEDWQRRRLGGVLPKRVLASFIEEEYNTYENRVTARLIDDVERTLSERIAALIVALKTLRELKLEQAGANHRKWGRLGALLGNAFDAHRGYAVVERARDSLVAVRARLRGLRDSVLYRQVPRRSNIAGALRVTNVLAADQHYSRVAKLWRLFHTESVERIPTADAIYRDRQSEIDEYEQFCALTLCWSLWQLGFRATDGRVPRRGESLELRGERTPLHLTLRWTGEGFVLEGFGSGMALQFLPLPHAFATEDGEARRVRLAEMRAAASRRSGDSPKLIVLYPGTLAERRALDATDARELTRHRLDAAPGEGRDLTFIGVAPLEVDAVERLARTIRWAIACGQWAAFPPKLQCRWGAEAAVSAAPSALAQVSKDEVLLLRPPSSGEYDRLIELSGRGPYVHGSEGRARGRPEPAPPSINRTQLDRAIQTLGKLAECPVCPERAKFADIEATAEGFFRAECNDCGTVWGVRICRYCTGHYPMILPGGIDAGRTEQSPDWVDVQFGQDVLASPCWSRRDAAELICPHCGRCPNAEKREFQSCDRCSCAAAERS